MRTKLLCILFISVLYFSSYSQTCIECGVSNPINNGLIFCAPMQGNANDVTTSPVTPTISGATALTTDRIGNANKAYNFSNISTAKIKYNTSSKINLPANQSLSMSIWFFARSTHANPSEFFRIVSSNNSSFEIFIGGTVHGPSLDKKLALLNFDGPSASSIILLQTTSDITLNTWHHTVVTVDKTSNTTSLYLDGVLVTSGIVINNALSNNSICIGNHETNAWGFDGKIDDARIYNRALTATEVSQLYSSNSPIVTPLNNQTICQGDSVQLTATGGSAYTWSPTTGLSNPAIANPYAKPTANQEYIVTITNGACNATDTVIVNVSNNCCADCKDPFPLNTGLVACYPLSGNANDDSNNGNNGTITNATSTTDRRNEAAKAYSFNGTATSYMRVPPSATLNTANMSGFTYACWFNAANSSTPISRRIMNIQDPSNRNYDIAYDYITNKIIYTNFNVSAAAVMFNSKITCTLNTWYHVAVTIDASNNSRLYINGELDTFATNTIVKPQNPTYSFGTHLVYNWNFVGKIDDIRVYNRALSLQDIKELMPLGKPHVLTPFVASADANICKGDSVQLSAATAYHYTWTPVATLSNNIISNPFAKPNDTTRYYVTGRSGLCVATDSVTVNIKTIAVDAGLPQSICSGDSVRLNATGGTNYKWRADATLSDTTIFNPFAKPTTNKTYHVTISDGLCSNIDSVTVSITTIPVDAGLPQSICSGDSVRLNATGGINYRWRADATLSDTTIFNPFAKPTTNKTYHVTVSDGLCSNIDSVTVSIVNSLTTNAGSDQIICFGDSVQLTAIGGTIYTWLPILGLSNSSIANPKASPANTTDYIVKGQSASCFNYDTVRVTVQQKPIVDLGVDTVKCANEEFYFYPAITNGDSYNWQPASMVKNASTAFTSTTATSPQLYTLVVTNSATGCATNDAIFVDVSNPKALFLLDDTLGTSPPLDVVISNTSSPSPLSYQWIFGDSIPDTSSLFNPSYSFLSPGRFPITLTVTDEKGCVDKLTQFVTVLNELTISIPNAFTPNGDGINDLFEVRYSPGSIKGLTGEIWNRWGSKVHSFSTPANNWWDGKIEGAPASAGVYYFTLEVLDNQQRIKKYNGTLTILR